MDISKMYLEFIQNHTPLRYEDIKSFIENNSEHKTEIIYTIKNKILFTFYKCDNPFKLFLYLYQFSELHDELLHNLNTIICLNILQIEKYLCFFENEDKFNEYINNNFRIILSNADFKDIIIYFNRPELFRKVFLSKNNQQLYIDYINNNKEKYADYLIRHCHLTLDNTSIELLVKTIIDLCKNENVNISDVKQIGNGSYSVVYKIGTKVLKLGRKRYSYNIPNNKYILKPLVRFDFSTISDTNCILEISNYVDTSHKFTKDELRQLYMELRNNGIIYGDIKSNNLGILLKDNNFNYIKTLNGDMKTRGLIGSYYDDELKKGDIVIIDSDHLFYEEDDNINLASDEAKLFESEYLRKKICKM